MHTSSSCMMYWKPRSPVPAHTGAPLALTLLFTCLSPDRSLHPALGNLAAWLCCCLTLTLGGSIYLSTYINLSSLSRLKTPGRQKIVIYIFLNPQNPSEHQGHKGTLLILQFLATPGEDLSLSTTWELVRNAESHTHSIGMGTPKYLLFCSCNMISLFPVFVHRLDYSPGPNLVCYLFLHSP